MSGGRIRLPAAICCCIPPRASQIASSTNPPPAVTTHAISAAHFMSAPFAAFRLGFPRRGHLHLRRRARVGWLEGHDELRDLAVAWGHEHSSGLLRRLTRPAVAGDDAAAGLLLRVEDQHFVVERTLAVCGGDLLAPAERPDRNALELELRVLGEPFPERLPVAGTHALVVGRHVVVEEVDPMAHDGIFSDHGVSPTGARRGSRSVLVPRATPTRMSASPPIANAVIASSRSTAP